MRIISVPERGWPDWIIFAGNLVLVLVGIGGIVVAVRTLRKIERQTKAIETQAKHMVDSERPFLMIEALGDSTSVSFKLSNRGRSPAKILFMDRALLQTILPITDKLPATPEYERAYHYAVSGEADLVNAEWIAPEGQTSGSYQARATMEMSPELEREVSSSRAQIWQYGVVVYRGLFGDGIYESRYCYRLGDNNWHMLGPYEYNKYT